MTKPPGVAAGTTWVWFRRDRWSTGRPERADAVDAALAVGMLVAVLAARAGTAGLPGAFWAQATVALVADDRVVPAADDAGPG